MKFAEDGSALAKGAEAAGKVLSQAGVAQAGKWANTAKTLAKAVPGLSEKIGVEATDVAGKTLYKATNTAGHIASAAVGTVKNLTVQAGKYAARPTSATRRTPAKASSATSPVASRYPRPVRSSTRSCTGAPDDVTGRTADPGLQPRTARWLH
jgi:hypothetical protein